MIRTNNVLDTCELKKALEQHSIADTVADEPLHRLDGILDAINGFSRDMGAMLCDMDDKGATLAGKRAVYLSLYKLFKQAVDAKCAAILK